jgi:hypothetical protein
VAFDGARAQEEPRRDLGVGPSAAGQLPEVPLPGGELIALSGARVRTFSPVPRRNGSAQSNTIRTAKGYIVPGQAHNRARATSDKRVRTEFRFLCPTGCGGSTPPSLTPVSWGFVMSPATPLRFPAHLAVTVGSWKVCGRRRPSLASNRSDSAGGSQPDAGFHDCFRRERWVRTTGQDRLNYRHRPKPAARKAVGCGMSLMFQPPANG